LFINDSKATTINSVQTAIESCIQEKSYKRVLVLIGGKDKKLPWSELKSSLQSGKIKPYFFGESAQLIVSALNRTDKTASTLNTLLDQLKPTLESGDIILLSPGGTSYDEFNNFEERGDFFRSWVLANFN
ncbi:MAG: mitochondrial fission ELM1 family protein, partial [Bdellovibrionales bacterium]|nr:mitochondrial fission ELM1 family protein [Bdellovibrionales bacterium]